ncbi:RNA polymerase sigma24 factor [Actinomycetospora sp. NBRC 106375]|uniref:RNA polymerase sigma factor SigJ n=1 Tax=Actinomycetospora sp. NBRC 106375 TaxID=3032207 RepID=UPI0024A09D55|nr:RNA polymerase sigma factor SigJ [Actinomycetospora sp. NBRC 106375]GLZ49376.1 RNA polymerase sigma24 factor [Actinomycetospora sp. NBRC 106375]
MTAATETFTAQRPRLFGLAYRMLGSAHDAEDVVQDAWLRWSGHGDEVDNPAAWLTTVVTRLSLNRLDSARARRETYVGPWLPEPILTTDPATGPAATVEERETVSLALLTTLERLTPPERAVYVLREAFGHSHAEVAAVLDVTEAGSRQLHTRARRHLTAAPVTTAPATTGRADVGPLLARFVAAARDGDVAGLEAMLAADVTVWSDGGGKVSAARRPIRGRDDVARFLLGVLGPRNWRGRDTAAEINGAPALLGYVDDELVGVLVLDAEGDAIRTVRFQRNPDKLAFLAGQLSRSEGLSGRPS